MANPTLLDMPIARDGNKNTIPTTDNGTTGLLSQQYGWQLINAIPPQQGGKAVKREDFNGALYLLSNLLFYAQKGWVWEFDETQSYFAGCTVKDTVDGKTYVCIADVNASTTHPSSDTTHWKLSDFATKGDLAKYLPLAGGTMTGATIKRNVDNEYINLIGGNNSGASLLLYGKDADDGSLHFFAGNGSAQSHLFQTASGDLKFVPDNINNSSVQHDLGGSAIVAENIEGGSGYRKTADGLIIQWGTSSSDNAAVQVDFPISFTTSYRVIASIESSLYNTAGNFEVRCYEESNSFFKVYVKHDGSSANIGFSWIAIGM